MNKIIILGAGVGGLSAACWLKQFTDNFIVVEEKDSVPLLFDKGVHYLHSKPRLPFDFEFKEIFLHDCVLTENGKFKNEPDLMDNLQYSEKIKGVQYSSSIFEIGKQNKVFVPADNNMNSLIKKFASEIPEENFLFSHIAKKIDTKKKIITLSNKGKIKKIKYDVIISTIPLNIMANMAGVKIKEEDFSYSDISILNMKVDKISPNWLINIYVPNPDTLIYRASIINGQISIESTKPISNIEKAKQMFYMFHIDEKTATDFNWRNAKINSIDNKERIDLLNVLGEMGIVQIGRYGMWDNKILIDETIEQSKRVTELISQL